MKPWLFFLVVLATVLAVVGVGFLLGIQNLNAFQLKDGPLVPAGSTKLHLSLLLYGFENVRMSPDMEVWLDGKKLPAEVIPYRKIEQEIPVDPIGKGRHQLILKAAGKVAMTYDFYGI